MAHATPQVRLSPQGPVPLAERLVSPFQRFARFEAASGIVLLACAAGAMVLANSPLGHAYHDLLRMPATVGVGSWSLTLSIEAWINDALMATFFFLVGLEIKREVLVGDLSSVRKAAVPVVAAAGGMLVPGLIYFSLNRGNPETAAGWGIPTATDIAFSLGVLALLGRRVPAAARIFLATLAIADDLGALIVIALFYTTDLNLSALAGAGACVAAMLALGFSGVRRAWPYALVGLVLWFFVLTSGVHATIAGVLGAMAIPVKTRVDTRQFVAFSRHAVEDFAGAEQGSDPRGIVTNPRQQAIVQGIEDACDKVQTPLHTLEHAMAPWIAFLVIPIFALANAGVELRGNLAHAFSQRETLGVMLGLMLGKPIGITLATWACLATRVGALPTGVTMRHIHGMSWLAGIGFTMSLFIAHLAFKGPNAAEHLNDAKLGIISGSILAAIVGYALLARGKPS